MKKCKDGYEKHPEYSEGETGIMNKDDDLTSVGQYELVGTRDIKMYNQDLQLAQPLENPAVPVSSSAAPGKSIGQTEWGIPSPDGDNYHILNFADDHDDPTATNPTQVRYDLETKVWIESYPSTMVGMPIQKATQEEITQYLVGEPGDIRELPNTNNFEIAEFLLQSGLSMKQRQHFLNLGKIHIPHPAHQATYEEIKNMRHDLVGFNMYKLLSDVYESITLVHAEVGEVQQEIKTMRRQFAQVPGAAIYDSRGFPTLHNVDFPCMDLIKNTKLQAQ
ncbi:hypothetical protein FRC11_008158 [Ceratobasidium sp. 423]|nr:hypothetical protein FRC11_008158 [Ceratobasidium sp. 423]